IMVPNEVEEALSRHLVNGEVRHDIPADQADSVFEGAVPINRGIGDWAKFQDNPDNIKHHVTEQKILGDTKDTLRTPSGGKLPVPGQVSITEPGQRPNFATPLRTSTTSP